MSLVAHHRQFVVGPEPRPLADNWQTVGLGFGLWLTYCPDLRVAVSDSGSSSWVLLGLAVQTIPGAPDPIDELRRCSTDDVVDRSHNWAGRWVLLGDAELFLDASGQLGCHWWRSPDGSVWASSSPAAPAILAGAGPRRPHQLRYERGLSWFVPPASHRPNVSRLLPSRILHLSTGRTRPRELLPTVTSEADPVADLAQTLVETVRRIPTDGPLHLALTAGADSRCVLAAAVASGRTFEVFTRRSGRMSIADRLIPPGLAAAVGRDHAELLPHRRAPQADRIRENVIHTHSDGAVAGPDVQPLLDRTRDHLNGFEIGGQGFGAGKAYRRWFPAEIDNPAALAELVADDAGEPKDSPNRHAMAQWLACVSQDLTEGVNTELDWRDRFYLEQRMAGWQAPKEQVYDLHEHQRIIPVNSARAFSQLLAVDEADRADGRHQRRLLEVLDDRLLAFPMNPPSSDYSLAARARHLWTVDRRAALRRAARHVSERPPR